MRPLPYIHARHNKPAAYSCEDGWGDDVYAGKFVIKGAKGNREDPARGFRESGCHPSSDTGRGVKWIYKIVGWSSRNNPNPHWESGTPETLPPPSSWSTSRKTDSFTSVRHTTFHAQINSELLTASNGNLWYSSRRNCFLNKRGKRSSLDDFMIGRSFKKKEKRGAVWARRILSKWSRMGILFG